MFCTSDGFVLDVFVAQGWRENDAKGLETLLQSTFDQLSWGDAGSPNAKMKQLQQQKSSGAVDAVPARHPQKNQESRVRKKAVKVVAELDVL